MPYRFGTYNIYQADTESQTYQFTTYLNLTQTDTVVQFPQYMYEAILKKANNNPDFKFSMTTQPYPELAYWETVSENSKQGSFTFMAAIAIAVIPTAMISFLITERMKSLKHMQQVSGMNVAGYWIANMLTDIVKVLIPMIIILIFGEIAN